MQLLALVRPQAFTPSFFEYWTAKEALAVFEFIDEIRGHIWSQYDTQIVAAMREERRTNAGLPKAAADLDDEDIF